MRLSGLANIIGNSLAGGHHGAAGFENLYSTEYDGVDDYVDLGNPTELQFTTAFSISLWFKSTDTSDYVLINKDKIGGHLTNDRSWFLWGNRYGGTSELTFGIRNGSTAYSTNSTTNYNDGNWHHVVGVFEPSTALRLYVDGALNSQNTTSIPATTNNVGTPVEIGRNANGSYVMNGNIDEVGIFNTILSASDVSAIYNGGTPQSLDSYNPVGYWRFESGSGTTAIDSGSGGNNGTLVNGTSFSTDVPT